MPCAARAAVPTKDGRCDERVAEKVAARLYLREVGALGALRVLVEGPELLECVVAELAECDNVDADVRLLHLLRQLNQVLLVLLDRAAVEDDYPLLLRLVLPVLERQLSTALALYQ